MARYKNKWYILSLASSVGILVNLDISSIPVAVPTLEKVFSLLPVEGLWIINSYLLAMLAFYLLCGKLANIYGKKNIFLIGFALFGFGSLLAALSMKRWWLIISRAIQGIGGALSFPTMNTILLEHFPPNEKGKAMGINSGISSISLLIGPTVGGFFVEYLSWRYIFWINLPIVAGTLLASMLLLPKEEIKKQKIHIFGATSALMGSAALVIALMEGNHWHWDSFKVVGLLILFLICALLFFYSSQNVDNPLIELSLLKSVGFILSNLCIFLIEIVSIFSIFFAIFLQKELEYSPFQAGLIIVIGSLPLIFISPLSGFLFDRFSAKVPAIIGSILLVCGFILFFFIPLDNYTYFLPPLFFISSGYSLARGPSFTAGLSSIPSHHLNTAVTIQKWSRQFALTFGMAILATIAKAKFDKLSYRNELYFLLILFMIFSFLILIIASFNNTAEKKGTHS